MSSASKSRVEQKGKSSFDSISGANTSRESVAYRSFRSSNLKLEVSRKVTTGISGLWRPAFIATLLFDPSMSALPIIVKREFTKMCLGVPGCAKAVPEMCQGGAKDVPGGARMCPRRCQGCARDVPRCQGGAKAAAPSGAKRCQDVPRRCQGGAKAVPRRCQGGAKGVPRRAKAVPRRCQGVPRSCQGGAKDVPRRCQGGAKDVPRMCQGGAKACQGRAKAVPRPCQGRAKAVPRGKADDCDGSCASNLKLLGAMNCWCIMLVRACGWGRWKTVYKWLCLFSSSCVHLKKTSCALNIVPSLPGKGGQCGVSLVSSRNATWLICPVVICLSQRLSHACVSMNKLEAVKLLNGSLNRL
ncbi:hypothetical protein Syun_006793 [Stephania yunnanensis]|uniref:Uncharacterized protein n=1 Tax=Stephania yunnanensis TaxID=152371 RepID=A0AAP0KX71_9MAGN